MIICLFFYPTSCLLKRDNYLCFSKTARLLEPISHYPHHTQNDLVCTVFVVFTVFGFKFKFCSFQYTFTHICICICICIWWSNFCSFQYAITHNDPRLISTYGALEKINYSWPRRRCSLYTS